MDINELITAKLNMDEHIAKIVMDFTKKTGLPVHSIDLKSFYEEEKRKPVHYIVDTTILIKKNNLF